MPRGIDWLTDDMRLRFPRGIGFLMITAMLAIVVLAALVSLATFALVESPLHCPPTMGCCEHRDDDSCSTWGGLLQPARDSERCTGK
jgi:hypothetical protein